MPNVYGGDNDVMLSQIFFVKLQACKATMSRVRYGVYEETVACTHVVSTLSMTLL